MATLNTVRAVLKDVRMREQAGEIQKTVGLLLDDVRRLDDRVEKLKSHFAQTEKDLRDIETSADRITKRGQRILDVDLGDRSDGSAAKPAARRERSGPAAAALQASACTGPVAGAHTR